MRILRDIPKRLSGLKFLRRSTSVLVLALADGLALAIGLEGAAGLSGGGPALNLAPLLVAAWIVLFTAFRLYDRAPVRRSPGGLVGAAFCWAGLVSVGAAIYPESGLGLGETAFAALLAFLGAGSLRFLYERAVGRIYRRGFGQTPVLVAGNDEDRERLRRIMEHATGAYVLAGEVDLGGGEADVAALRGALDRTEARGVVLVGAERLPDEDLLELIHSVRLRGVPLRVVPGAFALMRGRTILSEGMGLPLLEVHYPGLDNTQRTLKRVLDVAVSVLGVIFFSPLLLAVAVAVRLDSPGPVLFRQKRVGADEKVFICYMFRTMQRDAEVRQATLEDLNEAEGPVFKIRKDPRVTRVGRFLRRWSIDELPQLVNVLKGEMSLVGPRPLPVRDFLRMEEPHKRRLGAIPGMTGYWQTSGRSNLSFEEMVRLDLYYIENWSLSFDLKIILKTLGTVLRREGAY
ncbi:Undecaprenyl-phosphate glycophosphotransferase [uncultured Rubrobacteraceae bacterium]|uniref:Undecaprenyl-phosphate glycophosphotransferase n=1 Tax=uncultured Rubrobacteraceae bacterium TaxID=349277 RepID=A0A6J4Q1R1_9ACTN|nr:Undecaprenyl-phosphate glycophosphotransferase [uncultured Rubrobacteraceae bacterium]